MTDNNNSNARVIGRRIPDPPKIHIFGSGPDQQILEYSKLNFGTNHQQAKLNRTQATIGEAITDAVSNADGAACFPNTKLFDLVALIDEMTVGNPMFCHNDVTSEFPPGKRPKPRVLLGDKNEWQWFYDVLKPLKDQRLLRFDPREFMPVKTAKDACRYLTEALSNPQLRRHQKANQNDKVPDEMRSEGTERDSKITVAYFGSASTKNSQFLGAARTAAKLAATAGWNIVHGGGFHGVMGALTETVRRDSEPTTHVTGITVCDKYGAPAIALERVGSEEDNKMKKPDHMIYAKDMTQRMIQFGLRSHAYVVLPGGIGSLHEILQVAHDQKNEQAHTRYEDEQGTAIKKPLILVNLKNKEGQGLWDGLIRYLRAREPELLNHAKRLGEVQEERLGAITVVDSVEQAHELLKKYFQKHPPNLEHTHVYASAVMPQRAAAAPSL